MPSYSWGWKVVAVDEFDVMYSCISTDPVRYEYDEWATPNEGSGPLTVFTKRSMAQTFVVERMASVPRDLQIKRCKYVASSETHVWSSVYDPSREDPKEKYGQYVNLKYLPAHTALASQVMILER